MEGVVVSQWSLFAPKPASSSQIILNDLSFRIRLVFEIFRKAQIDVGRVPQPASPQWSQN
jgi:hypothetical protein